MPEYISREAAIVEAEKVPPKDRNYRKYGDIVRSIPAADVVEVVRCRECIFWDTSWSPEAGVKNGAHYCPRCRLVTLKDSFCSGAYRKDGGQDDA